MIIFLYGHDSFRSRRVLHEMKAKFTKEIDTEENSLDTVDGQETTSEKINESINTGSLFARKRMLIVENIFLSEEYLIAMLVRQFKILLRLKEAKDSGQKADEIASSLKLHPYVVKKGLSQINNFTFEN